MCTRTAVLDVYISLSLAQSFWDRLRSLPTHTKLLVAAIVQAQTTSVNINFLDGKAQGRETAVICKSGSSQFTSMQISTRCSGEYMLVKCFANARKKKIAPNETNFQGASRVTVALSPFSNRKQWTSHCLQCSHPKYHHTHSTYRQPRI